jgi:hypothetical protein
MKYEVLDINIMRQGHWRDLISEFKIAIFENDVDKINDLIKDGVYETIKSNKNEQNLLHAIWWGRLEIAKILIDNGADVSIVSDNSKTDNIIDFMPKIRYHYPNIYTWITSYEAQKKILTKDERLFKFFIKNEIPFDPKIKDDFFYLISANNLNLL